MTGVINEPSPLVSIIMPLYNKRPYVGGAIRSVQKQTFKNWELIIIDDGSIDGSADEIPLDDSKIKSFRQSNAGPSAARNNGIKRAAGKFITFIDADDLFYPNKLEEELKLIRDNHSAEWIISAFDYQSDEQLTFRSICTIHGRSIEGKPVRIDNALKQLKVQGWPIDGLFIKRTIIDRIGGFNQNMPYSEITEFMIRCACEFPRIAVHPSALYRVVKVENSLSEISANKKEGVKKFSEILCHLAKKYPEYENELFHMADESLRTYVGMLVIGGERQKAIDYLKEKCPLSENKRSLKLILLSYIPKFILKSYFNKTFIRSFF